MPQMLDEPVVSAALEPNSSSSSPPGALLPGRRSEVISKSKFCMRCCESEKSTVRNVISMPSLRSAVCSGVTTRISPGWSLRNSIVKASFFALRSAPSR
ncbi:hypothetical protein D9M68_962800 [compost metagenome]